MRETNSEFACATLQETRFVELLYGSDHGADRQESTKFPDQLQIANPDMYPVAFIPETWHRMNVDFCDGMYGGIRRLFPLMPDACDRGYLRGIAIREHGGSGKPVFEFPAKWDISSEKGFWKRTSVAFL